MSVNEGGMYLAHLPSAFDKSKKTCRTSVTGLAKSLRYLLLSLPRSNVGNHKKSSDDSRENPETRQIPDARHRFQSPVQDRSLWHRNPPETGRARLRKRQCRHWYLPHWLARWLECCLLPGSLPAAILGFQRIPCLPEPRTLFRCMHSPTSPSQKPGT